MTDSVDIIDKILDAFVAQLERVGIARPNPHTSSPVSNAKFYLIQHDLTDLDLSLLELTNAIANKRGNRSYDATHKMGLLADDFNALVGSSDIILKKTTGKELNDLLGQAIDKVEKLEARQSAVAKLTQAQPADNWVDGGQSGSGCIMTARGSALP